MVTLIIATTMISGLLINLQNKKIDYDAVAYRTGVILTEDPGEPNNPINNVTITELDQWEFIGYDQRDRVRRFGLTLYKSSPRILSQQKVASFYDPAKFPDLSDYRERVIFGDFPYRFNITLRMLDDSATYTAGEPYNPDSAYGYIRRIVLVKNSSHADVDMYDVAYDPYDPGDGRFYVNMDYGWLMMNLTGSPQYWVEPPKEDITINLYNISNVRNQSYAGEPVLNAIRIEFYGRLLSGVDVYGDLPIEVPATVNGTYDYLFPWPGTLDIIANETVNVTFPAGYFIPPSAYANITLITVQVRYEFDPQTVNITQEALYYYHYGRPGFVPPQLEPAVLEVRVW
jgi:hypothetical protein